MKKIILIAAFAALATGCCSPANAAKLTNPDHEYEIDTWGSNSEVYEFTPKSNPNMSCVFVILDNVKAMGLQCFPKVK